MRTINLRAVQTVSFRQSEATNFDDFAKKYRPLVSKLKRDDAVLFISQTGDQLVFVHGFQTAKGKDRIARVLRSERLRLVAGTWSPWMLKDYAARVGLRLEGHKSFEEWFTQRSRKESTTDKVAKKTAAG